MPMMKPKRLKVTQVSARSTNIATGCATGSVTKKFAVT
jgi:hypothetical protein